MGAKTTPRYPHTLYVSTLVLAPIYGFHKMIKNHHHQSSEVFKTSELFVSVCLANKMIHTIQGGRTLPDPLLFCLFWHRLAYADDFALAIYLKYAL